MRSRLLNVLSKKLRINFIRPETLR